MSPAIIRPIEVNDKRAWLELWHQYYDMFNSTLAPEVTETTFNRFLNPDLRIYCAVATASIGMENEQSKVVGFVTYYPHITTNSIDDKVYMQDLFVSPDAQGRGIGKQLVTYVYEQARRMHACSVYWISAHDNHSAQAMYAKIGDKTDQVVWKKVL